MLIVYILIFGASAVFILFTLIHRRPSGVERESLVLGLIEEDSEEIDENLKERLLFLKYSLIDDCSTTPEELDSDLQRRLLSLRAVQQEGEEELDRELKIRFLSLKDHDVAPKWVRNETPGEHNWLLPKSNSQLKQEIIASLTTKLSSLHEEKELGLEDWESLCLKEEMSSGLEKVQEVCYLDGMKFPMETNSSIFRRPINGFPKVPCME